MLSYNKFYILKKYLSKHGIRKCTDFFIQYLLIQKPLRMFSVVVFNDKSEVEVIPSSWLKSSCQAYWPPLIKNSSITKAVKSRTVPDPKEWMIYDIRILATCDTYEDARQKLIRAEDTSDLATDNEIEMGKGARKRIERHLSVSEDSEEETYKKRVCLPSVPVFPKSPAKGRHQASLRPVSTSPTSNQTLYVPQVTGHQVDFRSLRPECSSPTSNQKLSVPQVTATDMEILRVLNTVQVSLEELRKEVCSQRVILDSLSTERAGQEASGNLLEDMLPVKTVDELDELEIKLQVREDLKRLTTQLSIIGGSNLKEAVRRMMSRSIGHSLAVKLNWAGRKGWKGQSGDNKKAFGGLRLCEAIKRPLSIGLSADGDHVDTNTLVGLEE